MSLEVTWILPAFAVTPNQPLVASDPMPLSDILNLCIYVSHMIVLHCIDNFKTILMWKPTFDPCDPITQAKGPKQMCMHESYRQAILHKRIIAFQEKKEFLTPVTPNDPIFFR